MSGWWAAAAAGAQAGGSLTTTLMNINQAEVQREWAGRMADSEYQRRVRDLKLAGLNPLLAYEKGGAGVPSVGQAQASDVGEAAGRGFSAYWEYKMRQKGLELQERSTDASVDYIRAQTETQRAITEKVKLEPGFIDAETKRALEAAGLSSAEAARVRADTEGVAARAQIWRALRPVIGDVIKAVGRIGSQAKQLEGEALIEAVKKDLSAQARVELEQLLKNGPWGAVADFLRELIVGMNQSRTGAAREGARERADVNSMSGKGR